MCLTVILWIVAWQALLSMEFSRPEYWAGSMFSSPEGLPNPGNKPRSPTLQEDSLPAEPPGKPKNTGMGSLSFLQHIFQTQESNPGLPHCRKILYQLSHKGSPRILAWVAYPFSGDLPDPGIKWGSPTLQVDSLPTELSVKACMQSSVQLLSHV